MLNIGRISHVKRKKLPAARLGPAVLVVLALIVQMLAPFSHALAFDVDGDFNYQIICTSTGVKQIAIGADGQPDESRDVESSCPCCFLHGAPVLLLPESVSELIAIEAVDGAAEFEAPVQHCSTSVYRTALNPPRAPPFTV